MTTEIEVWRKVNIGPKWTGKYEVSSHGRVRHAESGKIKAPFVNMNRNGDAYLRVSLWKDNAISKKFYVHRLVAAAFHPIHSAEKMEVDHINVITTDNRASNLQWVTSAQNKALVASRLAEAESKMWAAGE